MQLGADIISIEIAGEAYELRPSLRACMRLTHRHGLPALAGAASDFNLGIVLDMLKESAIRPAVVLGEISTLGLGKVRNRLMAPLSHFVLALAGIDPDATTSQTPASGKQLTPAEYHARLFEIATGWLGWTPEQTWRATPAEILGARTGRTDLITDILKAVFGAIDKPDAGRALSPYTPEKLAEIEATGFDPEFDRAGLHALKAKIQGGA